MATEIKFNADGTINFGDYTLTFTDEGFEFDGSILATEYEARVPQAQGSVSGYTSGAQFSGVTPAWGDIIDKFPFASDGNATDVGDLTVARIGVSGQSSGVSGYTSSGYTNPPASTYSNVIDKFPFAVDANATDVGDLTIARYQTAGQSSEVSGYTSGGNGSYPLDRFTIDKFPFAADGNATDVGNLTSLADSSAGQSSDVSGYTSGGARNVSGDTIDKFPFAADANATDVGDLTRAHNLVSGQSSTTSGYTSGGGGFVTVIDKFPFAADGNATDVGDLTVGRRGAAGQSSTVSGYTSGGTNPTASNIIDKFPFASDANATDVGDVTVARLAVAGQQV